MLGTSLFIFLIQMYYFFRFCASKNGEFNTLVSPVFSGLARG